jgi:Zn-dependent protease with chaperone function
VTFAQRFALVMLAAYFVSSVAGSLAALPFAEALLRPSARGAADSRARGLALFRLLPAFAAMVLTLLVLAPGYYAHEQRTELESAGLLLTLCAAGGALILLCAVVRTCRAVTQTAKLRRSWLANARPLNLPHAGMRAFEIDVAFPLVAVLGAVRPRLFISTTVLRACTEDEIAAIIEHERRHVLSADNIMRVLMDAAPDALALTPLPGRLAEEWHRAVEHRADEAATRRLDLASALVRVARLAKSAGPVSLPASALYRGEGVEERVRRLLAPANEEGASTAWPAGLGVAAGALTVAVMAVAFSDTASRLAHGLLEAAVSLP